MVIGRNWAFVCAERGCWIGGVHFRYWDWELQLKYAQETHDHTSVDSSLSLQ
jgi:hypothetical protein